MDITKFAHEEFGEIRTVERDGERWFVAADVARALGYSDTSDAVRRHADAEDRATFSQVRAQNGVPPVRVQIINESGVYALIFGSKLPSARGFQRWVTREVLPSIRQHGGYLAEDRTSAQNARLAEMIKYREAQDMLTLATDYVPSTLEAQQAFSKIQDMLLVKVTGHHAPALRAKREIVTWKGKRGPTKNDKRIAKNYLSEPELTQLRGLGNVIIGELQYTYPVGGYSVAEFWQQVRAVAARY